MSRGGPNIPRKKRGPQAVPKDKFARRRHRLMAAGKCPACGKPCAPFAKCEYHRRVNWRHGKLNNKVYHQRIIISLDRVRLGDDRSLSDFLPSNAKTPLEILMEKEDTMLNAVKHD